MSKPLLHPAAIGIRAGVSRTVSPWSALERVIVRIMTISVPPGSPGSPRDLCAPSPGNIRKKLRPKEGLAHAR